MQESLIEKSIRMVDDLPREATVSRLIKTMVRLIEARRSENLIYRERNRIFRLVGEVQKRTISTLNKEVYDAEQSFKSGFAKSADLEQQLQGYLSLELDSRGATSEIRGALINSPKKIQEVLRQIYEEERKALRRLYKMESDDRNGVVNPDCIARDIQAMKKRSELAAKAAQQLLESIRLKNIGEAKACLEEIRKRDKGIPLSLQNAYAELLQQQPIRRI